MPVLAILFLIVPVIEMVVLIEVGSAIGSLTTIALVFLTAIVGVALLRQQGAATLLRAMRRMDHGALPAQEMLEGVVLAVGGALLLTPGFVTDALGFACLFPPTRRLFLRRLLRSVQRRAHRAAEAQSGTIHIIEGESDRRP
jgi:UPF0716 protein FxsA